MSEGILSIQSAVAYGHVGNSAAVFPMQRLGFEVWPVNTVLFSNHTGYGVWRGHMVELAQVREVIAGVRERGAFGRCQAVVSGYLGAPDLGQAVLETVAEVKTARPGAIYACDPVMGDAGRGFFVRPGIPEFFKAEAVPRADLVTPNQFELGYLAAMEIASLKDALAACAKVRGMGPSIVVCTSLLTLGADELGVLVDSAEGAWLVTTPRLDVNLNGTGDAFTALFLANWLATGRLDATLENAVAAMYGIVSATHEARSRELVLIAAQDQLVSPRRRFAAQQVR